MNTNIETAISELHKVFHKLNDVLFNSALPEPAILIQNKGNRKNVLGWCSTQEIWVNKTTQERRYEINIVAEYLNRSVYEVVSTLLHEMVHLHNLVNGIKDVSRGNVYHNKKFKKAAESHGLIIEYNEKLGWSLSRLNDNTKSIVDSMDLNKEAFSLARMDFSNLAAGGKSSTRKYVCPQCGAIIRTSKELKVICGECLVPFELS